MAKIILLALSMAMMLACVLAKPAEQAVGAALSIAAGTTTAARYSDAYDKDFDMQSVLNDEAQRRSYMQCFLGEAACTTEVTKYFKGT